MLRPNVVMQYWPMIEHSLASYVRNIGYQYCTNNVTILGMVGWTLEQYCKPILTNVIVSTFNQYFQINQYWKSIFSMFQSNKYFLFDTLTMKNTNIVNFNEHYSTLLEYIYPIYFPELCYRIMGQSFPNVDIKTVEIWISQILGFLKLI